MADFPTVEQLLAKIQNVSKQFVVLQGIFYGEQPFFEPECPALEDFLKLALTCGQKCLYLESTNFSLHEAVTEHLDDIEEIEDGLEELLEESKRESAGNSDNIELSVTDGAKLKKYLATITKMQAKYDVDGASPEKCLPLLDAIDNYSLTFVMGGVHHQFILYNKDAEEQFLA